MEYIIGVVALLALGYILLRAYLGRMISKYIAEGPVPDQLPDDAIFLIPTGGMRHMAAVAAAQAAKHKPAYIIVSGIPNHVDGIIETLISNGADPDTIILERHATDTPENGKFSGAVNPLSDHYPAVIFKQRFHLPRCKMNYRPYFKGELILYPVDRPGANEDKANSEVSKYISNWLRQRFGKIRDYPG